MKLRKGLITFGVLLASAVIATSIFSGSLPHTGYQEPPSKRHFLAQPYDFEFDTNASYGFERIYISYGAISTANFYAPPGPPVFVLSRGKSATVEVLVASLSNVTLHLSLDLVRGLPLGVQARLDPETFVLRPNEQVRLRLVLNASVTTPTSTKPMIAPLTATMTETLGFADYVELALMATEYSYGVVKGFYLTII